MLTYSILVLLILLCRNSFFSIASIDIREKTENKFCYFIWALIILLAALRSDKVGADTPGYMQDYKNIALMSFSDIFDRWDTYLGYYVPSKLFSMLGAPQWLWFGFVELVYAFAVQRFINKYSADKLLSILVFVCCGLFCFSLAGLKQTFAMAFMLHAFVFFVDKKYKYAVPCLVIAYLSHSSSLMFLPAFALYYIKNYRLYLPVLVASILGLYFAGDTFLMNAVLWFGNDHFETYLNFENTYSSVTLIFYVSLLLFSCVGVKTYLKKRPEEAKMAYGYCLMACGLQTLASISPSTFRLAYFYTPFYMVLLSNSTVGLSPGIAKQVRFVIIVSIVFFFLYTNRDTPYSFM